MEANVRDEWFGHGVEETIVDNDDKRSDDVVALGKLCVSHVVFANLIDFSRDSGFVFVVYDLAFQLAWKLIDTIVSIIFISDPESFLLVFIIAEAGKCTIDIISSSCIYVRRLIIVLGHPRKK